MFNMKKRVITFLKEIYLYLPGYYQHRSPIHAQTSSHPCYLTNIKQGQTMLNNYVELLFRSRSV